MSTDRSAFGLLPTASFETYYCFYSRQTDQRVRSSMFLGVSEMSLLLNLFLSQDWTFQKVKKELIYYSYKQWFYVQLLAANAYCTLINFVILNVEINTVVIRPSITYVDHTS